MRQQDTESIRVYIVDDHPVVCSGLVRILSADPEIEVIGYSVKPEIALSEIEKLSPSVVLLDIILPGMSGNEMLHKVKASNPDTKVIMLTAVDDEKHLMEAIEGGANGYLLKDTEPDELRRAIKQVLQGRTPLSPSVTKPLLSQFVALSKENRENHMGLTKRQLEILRMVASGATNKDIAGHFYLSSATVKRELNRIFAALGARDRSEAVAKAYQLKLFAEKY